MKIRKDDEAMTEFKSAIVDECGEVMYWCSELTKSEIDSIMDAHEEWRIRFIQW